MEKAIIIFVRNPEWGKVKTRLAATIGAEAALRIYKKLLQHTLLVTQQAAADKFVFYADKITASDIWQRENYFKLLQEDAGLGEKMKSAFNQIFDKGYNQVLIIGSDCPQLTGEHLTQAFAHLTTHDVVIGPATDGGYYLLGLKKVYPQLFENKAWSTATVYSDTLQTIEKSGLTYAALETLTDVDEEKDLPADWKIE